MYFQWWLLLPFMTLLTAPVFCQTQDMAQVLAQVRSKYFPELNELQIKVEEFEPSGYFLEANFNYWDILSAAHSRRYRVRYHRDCVTWPTPWLEAILVHELSHILDYSKMNSADLARLAIDIFFNKNSTYERDTDWSGLKRAPKTALGLLQQRQYVYKTLGPDIEKKYRKKYLSTEEIQQWIAHQGATLNM